MKFVKRSFAQLAAFDQLASVVNKSDDKVSFQINSVPQLFTWQCLPFHNVSAVDSLCFAIAFRSGEEITKRMNDREEARKVNTIVAKTSYKLHVVQASHPTYAEVQLIEKKKESKSKSGVSRMRHFMDCKLYDNNSSKRQLICSYQCEGLILTEAEAQGGAKARKANRIKVLSKSMKVSEFPFASPWNVGEFAAKCVFLSNLKQMNGSLRANGLFRLENGFDAHPWSSGTGDHINGAHSMAIFKQFVYLLLRSSDVIKRSERVDERFFELEDKECSMAVIECDVRFIRVVELGQFEVCLI